MIQVIKKEKKWIVVYLAFSLLLTAIRLINPILISNFFDNADTSDVRYLLKIVIVILIASIVTGFLNIFCSILDTKVRNKIVRKAKKEYLEKLLNMDFEILEKIDFGDKKLRYDLNGVYGELAISFIANTIIEIFTCVFIFVYLLTINHIMTAVFVLCLLINSFLEYQIGKKSYKFSKEVTEIQSIGETKVTNALRNIAYIKTNNCTNVIVDDIDFIQMDLSRKQEQHTKEIVSIDNLNLQIYKVIEVVIFAVAAFMLKNETITVGQIYLFINYMGWIDNAFSTIWNNYIKYKSAKAKIDTINSTFIDIVKQPITNYNVFDSREHIKTLTIDNVGFKYVPGEFELNKMNMKLEKGDFVAIVGESGCGKSTFMKLISSLYHPREGSILYNDFDITSSSPEQRASKLAYVSQNIAIMDGTLYDIVDFLNLGVSSKQIDKALELANLHGFVDGLKDGVNTHISESGINLSGGQLQRLAVAQAMVYDKDVYIFDEITSGLDDITQNKLIDNLKTISTDKIMIFVTHRLNTLNQFNKVFEFKNGTMNQIDKKRYYYMRTNELIRKYLICHDKNNKNFLKENSMLCLYEKGGTDKNFDKEQNNMNCLYNQKMVCAIDRLLRDKGIQYVIFKGLCLAELLYDSPNDRKVGDIDIYVDYDRHYETMNLLSQLDIVKDNDKESDYVHHICLTNGKVMVELHKRFFNPFTNIDETYLIKNITTVEINKRPINSFTITATMLHLIYHLYMDTYLVYGSLYYILVNKAIPKAGRFLYRAYEIALFSEKYSAEINWSDIERDIKKQNLRFFFKKMIFDILEIFPEAFPRNFVHTVCNLNYVNDERDYLYKYFIESNMNNGNNFDVLLIDYINNNWESRRKNNIYKKVGENISLFKKSSNEINTDLSCDINTEKTTEGLKLVFKVSNDDFYISELEDYNTQTSDGVHLLLCGTEQYSYNSIFLFPKKIDGEIKVIVCDVLNNRNEVLGDNLIKADFSKTESDYAITAILSNQFLKENYLSSYLYMGLVISDCSSETHRRKNELILSEKSSEWYNPTYFAKIDIV